MKEAVGRLKRELLKINTGKATPAMVNDLLVNYYGSPTPLKQVANVAKSDARTLTIQPWEKSMLGPIEKSIFEANLGVTPMNDGELIRIIIPPLTEERRRKLGKRAKAIGEEAKVSVRNARREAMDAIKKAVKNGYPEDAGKKEEGNVQEVTNGFGKKIDTLVEAKEKDIMTV
jgi:ribosome recycling factor